MGSSKEKQKVQRSDSDIIDSRKKSSKQDAIEDEALGNSSTENSDTEEKKKSKHKKRRADDNGEKKVKRSKKSDKKEKESKKEKKTKTSKRNDKLEDVDETLSDFLVDNNDVNTTIDSVATDGKQLAEGDKQVVEDKQNEDSRKDEASEARNNGLVRFPDFSQQFNASEELATEALSMGIPHWLVHPTIIDRDFTVSIDNKRFALSPHMATRCAKAGIDSLFAVQSAVIPVLRAAHTLSRLRHHVRDLCVSAPTGSGKTLAFVIPIIERLRSRLIIRLRALVVLPTKDLAHQVKESFDYFCAGTDLRVGLATGDISLSKEQAALTGSCMPLAGGNSLIDILVCTPGRLMDHLVSTQNFTLQHLEFWVMDEADRLLGEGYHEWLSKVQSSIEMSDHTLSTDAEDTALPVPDARTLRDPKSKLDILARPAPRIQKLLFSATLTRDPAKIAQLKLTRPLYISITQTAEVETKDTGVEATYTFPSTLKEFFITCPADKKPLWLIYLLREHQLNGAVCFAKSLETAHRLAQVIQMWASSVPDNMWPEDKKVVVAEYSSDLPAAERVSIMRLFKQGKITLLICSDLIARGLDIDQIEVVINYDVPTHMSQYTHRVGRTARAGRDGRAYTLVGGSQAFHFKKMMKDNGHWSGFLHKISPERAAVDSLQEQYEAALEKVGSIYS
ncbi:ATP-dependent RNA helicase dbp6 [Coemansia sp. RSA 1813]|nr:ATP-dependent RNA helicase dbp6 [Coemansia sp. RSA 1646]KAJ1770127.1 ATP-dependent RNA helicase dbp6 [Coemansia sp. RSA 1843]KAJ2089834.1 ATP-dependent RNA helicase dbp6 [Coemansia sp. RSA 986]KAJ2214781.1 ATP-dependent RNA helicase dbp6 [Coemansia sp. RSA 487]KAJ2569768.1 ATP-dependent RNA helicase dbp6 [Coemansia sp. RSA 1813]